MKNYKKYADEIKNYNGNNFCKDFVINRIIKADKCEEKDCNKCLLLQFLWLMEEYEKPEEPEVDWNKIGTDARVLVRDYEDEQWERRYFAKYENGIIYAWSDGCTSWTAINQNDITEWKLAKLAGEGNE